MLNAHSLCRESGAVRGRGQSSLLTPQSPAPVRHYLQSFAALVLKYLTDTPVQAHTYVAAVAGGAVVRRLGGSGPCGAVRLRRGRPGKSINASTCCSRSSAPMAGRTGGKNGLWPEQETCKQQAEEQRPRPQPYAPFRLPVLRSPEDVPLSLPACNLLIACFAVATN